MACQSLPSPDLSASDHDVDPPRACKRKRSMPITPPATADDPDSAALLARAVHVLTTEAAALSHVSRLYATDPAARAALLRAVEAIVMAGGKDGKLVICGVGKSGYIAMKIVATMKSLGIACSFLHAAEALHGDLGDVRTNDVVLFVTFSGKTAELVHVAKHLPPSVTVMAITAHPDALTCPLLANRQPHCSAKHMANSILLPAPIHEFEETTFGVSAPTTSTTVALAIGDMLALTVAKTLHQEKAGAVFKKNHPGGTIGADARKSGT